MIIFYSQSSAFARLPFTIETARALTPLQLPLSPLCPPEILEDLQWFGRNLGCSGDVC